MGIISLLECETEDLVTNSELKVVDNIKCYNVGCHTCRIQQ